MEIFNEQTDLSGAPQEVRPRGKGFGVISMVVFSIWVSHSGPVYRVSRNRKLRKKSRNGL